MKKSIALLSLSALLPSAWSYADSGYINYRHQYAESTRMHSDRVKFGTRLDSGWGFEGELKYKTAGDRQDVAFDNTVGNGHELTISYQHKLNDRWTVTPSLALESIEKSTSYKTGIKVGYKVTDALSISGRYRYDSIKLDRDRVNESMPDNAMDNQSINRYDIWVNYSTKGPWTYEYQLTYFDADYIRYDNGTSDYEQNAAFKYRWSKQWVPFFEVGDIKVDSEDDKRQLRLRVGIQYNFM
ncbi:oligogalacturonate-specific porin KdgM family protein [Pseudomonas cichorii]|uniref:oligogalacturonate-specific porin KdgM family protein n=1 Tax=Pseudomonas cichorii TaxID=36746 RepID=UPI001C8A38E5|nr:oligogalacturonate-specific porin KdgM family protein [Pseudomonas cichorii]MBX8495417.1 oligogalacturonate-specific porin KdgM family protein [Pseudomonas cichorii]MBX8528769.1 oligogalacturonate-specific porin KdgM family protein [Pseudomonas cichorii]